MPEIDEHNFGYNNPNFVNGIIVDDDILNAVSFVDDSTAASDNLTPTSAKTTNDSSDDDDDDDRRQPTNDDKSDQKIIEDGDGTEIKRNASAQQLNNVKRRSTYAKLGAADMGVPHSPTCDDIDRLNVAAAEEERDEINTSSIILPFTDDDEQRRATSKSNILNDDERIYEVDNNTYFNRSAQSPPIIDDDDNVHKDEDKVNFEQFSKFLDEQNDNSKSETVSTATMMQNGNGHHRGDTFFGQPRGVDVDESPQDFRRNLAMIDQVAREGGAFYPGGGIQMRREGDTTIVTEHRDPYSFYWQLDKIRKQQDEAAAPKRDEISENAIEEVIAEESTQIQSPDSHDSGIHVEYSRPSKPVKKLSERFLVTPPAVARDESPQRTRLPPGWEKHEDPKGFSYYWHVDSGTVQREPPKASIERVVQAEPPRQMIDRGINAQPPIVVQAGPAHPQQPVIVERAFKQTTTKRRIENESADDREISGSATTTTELDGMKLPVRFAVRSLGWTEISEDDLTQERSSRAVNKAIVDLSTGRNDLIDNVSKWGDGKELIMELDDHDLRLIDPDTGTMLHTQPIHQIRVWGVGRDNGRDFAYVARDRNTRRFMCHVFRCDTPARTIANTLRDICKRLMLERRPNSLQTSTSNNVSSSSGVGDSHRKSYGNQHHQHQHQSNYGDMPHSSSSNFGSRTFSRDSFPTPMEEPKKIIRCHFLGVTQVPKATGIEILNEAVDRLVAQVRMERWILCDVSIAPSTITINEVSGNQIAECRVRYLSFLGIGRDVKHCAFIMQTSSDSFMCYVFHVEPSAGAMAKTIEAACKLRYQKVLDAHGERRSSSSQRGWGDTIRDVFGSFTGRRSGRSSSQYPR